MDNLKPTFLDKAISHFLPDRGEKRQASRIRMAINAGAFEANRKGTRPYDNYIKFLTSPNSRVNHSQRQELVDYSRFLCQSSLGTAVNNRLTDHSIGNGLNFRSSIDDEFLGLSEDAKKVKEQEFTRLWKVFFQGNNGHYERIYSGGYLQSMAFKSMLEGGDSFIFPVKSRKRPSHPFPFALQIVESERVSTPFGKYSDSNFVDGFEQNNSGIPVNVHVTEKTKNLGATDSAYHNPQNWQSRPIYGANTGIRQVYQLRNLAQDRPGAMRGIPFLTPTIGLIINHKEATDSILQAIKVQSIFAGVFSGGTGGQKFGKAPGGKKIEGTDSRYPQVEMTAGQVIDLPKDYELKGFGPTQPGKDVTPYQEHIISIVGAITGIPKSFIMMMFTKSYSASRGEAAIFWTTVLRNRYAFVFQFLFPFWEYLLSWGVASGLVSAPGFFDNIETRAAWLGSPIHQFSGPRMPQLDLEKEAKGLKLLRDSAFKSTRGIIEESFTEDPDEVFKEWKKEKEKGFIEAVANQTQGMIEANKMDEEDED